MVCFPPPLRIPPRIPAPLWSTLPSHTHSIPGQQHTRPPAVAPYPLQLQLQRPRCYSYATGGFPSATLPCRPAAALDPALWARTPLRRHFNVTGAARLHPPQPRPPSMSEASMLSLPPLQLAPEQSAAPPRQSAAKQTRSTLLPSAWVVHSSPASPTTHHSRCRCAHRHRR